MRQPIFEQKFDDSCIPLDGEDTAAVEPQPIDLVRVILSCARQPENTEA
jgi:hypothetical protein